MSALDMILLKLQPEKDSVVFHIQTNGPHVGVSTAAPAVWYVESGILIQSN